MDGGIDILRMKHPKRFGKRKCRCGEFYIKSKKYKHNKCPKCLELRKQELKKAYRELEKKELLKKPVGKTNRARTIYANQIQISDYSRHEVKTIWDVV